MKTPHFRLPWPPTDNHYYACVGGRKILSKRGREYKANALKEIMVQGGPRGLTGDVLLEIEVYPPDKRRRDIPNLSKAIPDVLTEAGVYGDDSQIAHYEIVREANDGFKGEVAIWVTQIENIKRRKR